MLRRTFRAYAVVRCFMIVMVPILVRPLLSPGASGLSSTSIDMWNNTYQDIKNEGKCKAFASLSENEKLEAIILIGQETNVPIFRGMRNEKKTLYFANLPEASKHEALNKFHRWPWRQFAARTNSGKTRYFAQLADNEKLKVLRYTDEYKKGEFKIFQGKRHEGKCAFFAAQSEKVKALALRAALRAARKRRRAFVQSLVIPGVEDSAGKTTLFAHQSEPDKLRILHFVRELSPGLRDKFIVIQPGSDYSGASQLFGTLPADAQRNALIGVTKLRGRHPKLAYEQLEGDHKLEVLRRAKIRVFRGYKNEGKVRFFATLKGHVKHAALKQWKDEQIRLLDHSADPIGSIEPGRAEWKGCLSDLGTALRGVQKCAESVFRLYKVASAIIAMR